MTVIAPVLAKRTQDEVLAVRVQAGAALAVATDTLWIARPEEIRSSTTLDKQTFNTILEVLRPSALWAAMDSDKVKPHGVQALGAIIACNMATGALPEKAELDPVIACLNSENAKVQWSACSAAGKVLEGAIKCSAPVPRQLDGMVDVLKMLARESPNSRTRALSQAALLVVTEIV